MKHKSLLSLLLAITLFAAEKSYEVQELKVVEDVVYEITSNRPADGLLKIYFKDGTLKTEVHLKEGKSSGVEKKFYPNGLLASTVPFLDGKEHGTAKRYFQDGGLQFVTAFSHGKKEGSSKEFYPDGSVKSEILFKKGEAVSGYKFLEDGTKKSVPKELLKWIQPNTGLF